MASAAASAGAGGVDCHSVYGSARTGDFSSLLHRWARIAFAWNGDQAHGTDAFDLYVKAKGGTRIAVKAGDVIHIPTGIPHQFFLAPGKQITYMLVKVVDPPNQNR